MAATLTSKSIPFLNDDAPREPEPSSLLPSSSAAPSGADLPPLLKSPWVIAVSTAMGLSAILCFVAVGLPWVYITGTEPGFTFTFSLSAWQQCATFAFPANPALDQSSCTSDAAEFTDRDHTLFARGCGIVALLTGLLGLAVTLLATLRLALPSSRAAELATRLRLFAGAALATAAALATCWAASVEAEKFNVTALVYLSADQLSVAPSMGTILMGLATLMGALATLGAWNLPRDAPTEYEGGAAEYEEEYTIVPPPRRAAAPLQQQQQAAAPRFFDQPQAPRPPKSTAPPVFREPYAPPQVAPAAAQPRPTFMSGTTASLSAGSTVTLPDFGGKGKAPPGAGSALLRRLKPAVAASPGDLATEVDAMHLVSRVLGVLDNIAPELTDAELANAALEFMRATFEELGVGAAKSASWMEKVRQKVQG